MLISAAVLSMIAGVQTAMAQKVTLYMAGNQTFECDITRLDSIVFSEGQTIPAEEIVVTVDANGNADGGHLFTKIDDNKFYIDDIKYTAESGALIVTGYDKAYFKGAANIISKLIYRGRTLEVVGIASNAFEKCGVLTSVTIPNSVTSIGNYAFNGCTSLTSVTIPNSVTSIGDYAFNGCTSLTSVTIPNSVTSIGNSAFWNCTGLTSVTLDNNAIVSADRQSDTSMKSIFGNQVRTYVLGNSVTRIGKYAFYGCSGLTSVTIPNSVTSIGSSAFYGCSGLTSITIPNSVTSIGSVAFRECTSLTSVTIPNSVTSIGSSAFYDCSNLTSVTIPNSVTSIGGSAFEGCTGLTAVHINDIAAWCKNGFSNSCSNPLYYAKHLYLNGEEIKDLTIPESVTSIGDYAFNGCTSLSSITIPNSVTSIGYYAFSGCRSLTSITIGSGVTRIAYDAFSYCQSLTDVYCYAENVPSADSYAFENSSIPSATLHVPAGSVNSYKSKSPWSRFSRIVAIE